MNNMVFKSIGSKAFNQSSEEISSYVMHKSIITWPFEKHNNNKEIEFSFIWH